MVVLPPILFAGRHRTGCTSPETVAAIDSTGGNAGESSDETTIKSRFGRSALNLQRSQAHLMKYPGVQSCAVVPIVWQRKTCLVAYVIGRPEFDLKSDLESVRLRSFLTNRVSPGMVPSAFVVLDALPITPNGKIDRRALPVPTFLPFVQQQKFVAPGTPVEIQLAVIWREVLGLERVGVHDNFFDLGGHSLLATQLVSRVRHQLLCGNPAAHDFRNADHSARPGPISHSGTAGPCRLSQTKHGNSAGRTGITAEENAAEQLPSCRNTGVASHPGRRRRHGLPQLSLSHSPLPEWFGKQKCNLLIVLNERYRSRQF